MTERKQFETNAEPDRRKQLTEALGLPTNGLHEGKKAVFAWEYLLALVRDAVSAENRGICSACNGSGFADATGLHACFKCDGNGAENRPAQDDVRDAQRYRWLRDQNNSLETRQYDKGIFNGPSCYHEVESIVELKHGYELDAAIDAAIASQSAKEPK